MKLNKEVGTCLVIAQKYIHMPLQLNTIAMVIVGNFAGGDYY